MFVYGFCVYYIICLNNEQGFIFFLVLPLGISHTFFQPLFKVLSRLWFQLQDQAEHMNILNSITINLQPFLNSQAKIFSESYLDNLLEESEVKTDEQRMIESSGGPDTDFIHTYKITVSKILFSYYCITVIVLQNWMSERKHIIQAFLSPEHNSYCSSYFKMGMLIHFR